MSANQITAKTFSPSYFNTLISTTGMIHLNNSVLYFTQFNAIFIFYDSLTIYTTGTNNLKGKEKYNKAENFIKLFPTLV